LVADIGGTNARFALAVRGESGMPAISDVAELQTADFASPAEAARHYLDRLAQKVRPSSAVFAVATPITGDQIKLTNSPWSFSIRALTQDLHLQTLNVINDFAAIGLAIPHLGYGDLAPVGTARAVLARDRKDGHFSALGPGTGLGVCHLLLRAGESIVIETEGGHIAFAPGTVREDRILEFLRRSYPRVSCERLISGPGLLNLYRAMCSVDGTGTEADSPEAITAAAEEEPQGGCARAVDLFCEILGGFAGDIVLAHGAWDGIYLAGGLVGRLLARIQSGGFRRRFEDKGRFQQLLAKVPVLAIRHPQAGLLGAGAAALSQA